MPRKRVKKPPKPPHVFPTSAVVCPATSQPTPQVWVDYVCAKLLPKTSVPFDDAVQCAARLAASGVAVSVQVVPEGGKVSPTSVGCSSTGKDL